MAISLLISYYILMPKYRFFNLERYYKKNIFLLIIAIGFHWVAIVFLPLILLKYKRYRSILFISIFGVMAFLLAFSFVEDFYNKVDIYRAVSFEPNSALHIQFVISLALFITALNLIFRSNNLNIRFQSFSYLYVIILILVTLEVVGYKAASRVSFILDLWIFFDLINFWVPKYLKKGYVLGFKSSHYRFQ